jgi:outer membrane lipoprotein-sorting protein
MNGIIAKMKMIFWGIMLLIMLMLTGSFIAMAMDAKNILNIMKEKKNTIDEAHDQRGV